jgi:hypothetical protein
VGSEIILDFIFKLPQGGIPFPYTLCSMETFPLNQKIIPPVLLMMAFPLVIQNLLNLLLKLLLNIRWCPLWFISGRLLNIFMVRFKEAHMKWDAPSISQAASTNKLPCLLFSLPQTTHHTLESAPCGTHLCEIFL